MGEAGNLDNPACDCNGNEWDEYCFDSDGDGYGGLESLSWQCSGSLPDGWGNCDDEDDSCASNEYDCAGICDGDAVEDSVGSVVEIVPVKKNVHSITAIWS